MQRSEFREVDLSRQLPDTAFFPPMPVSKIYINSEPYYGLEVKCRSCSARDSSEHARSFARGEFGFDGECDEDAHVNLSD